MISVQIDKISAKNKQQNGGQSTGVAARKAGRFLQLRTCTSCQKLAGAKHQQEEEKKESEATTTTREKNNYLCWPNRKLHNRQTERQLEEPHE